MTYVRGELASVGCCGCRRPHTMMHGPSASASASASATAHSHAPLAAMSLKKKSGGVPAAPSSAHRTALAGMPASLPAVPGEVAMLNPYGPTVGTVSAASLAWHNLLLLGFDPVAEAARNGTGPLSANMFDKPNARAMQLLLHWLLSLIRACPAADAHNDAPEWRDILSVFQHSYPCVDRGQARDFLMAAVGSLVGFEKGSAAVFPAGTIRKSHFAAPQGDRMYAIFWHLSTYALQLTLARQFPSFTVPPVSLPPLNEPALFPHAIRALKAHIVVQSQSHLTKLTRMQAAEDEWRAAAADITREYNECQASMASLAHTLPSGPHIPGQPHPDIESDKALFSTTAHDERMHRLQYVKELHAELNALHARTEQQRATLNLVLNGVWKPLTISRTQLERLLTPSPQGGKGGGEAKKQSQSQPIDLHTVVHQWNDSLEQMQQTLTHYLHSPSSSSQYLSGLNEANVNTEQHLKEHTNLEHDLVTLQTQLARAGTYSGPIHAATSPPPPALIPPTPFRSNQAHTSLAVPQTPVMQQAGYARIQFTPSNAGAPRPPSRIPDSVRRAAVGKSSSSTSSSRLGAMQPSFRPEVPHSSSLATIADDGEHSTIHLSPVSASQLQHGSDIGSHISSTRDAFLASAQALASPPAHTHLSSIAAADESSSPQYPKKLVFSPNDPRYGGSSSTMDAVMSPTRDEQQQQHYQRTAPLSNSSVTSTAPHYSSRSSLSPYTAAPSRIGGHFISPPPPAASTAARYTPSYTTISSSGVSRASPGAADSGSLGPGLLDDDELFAEDSAASAAAAALPRSRGTPADGGYARAAVHNEEDDEEDEVVFSLGHDDEEEAGGDAGGDGSYTTIVTSRRRVSSNSASSRVDPNAPTPQVAQRTERRYQHEERTPPQAYSSRSTGLSFRSPAYEVDGPGLLDDM